jgi:UDP-N-acetylglucosamine 2-epimerase (non-hydrolysing)
MHRKTAAPSFLSAGQPPLRIACILGTRPEAIKLAPVIQGLRARPSVDCAIVSTGQHRELLDGALADFGLRPDHDLALMRPGQTLTRVTAGALVGLEPWLAAERPDWIVVQGDTTSALAGALAGFYAGIPVAHVEAGLRTHDPHAPWPEEMNRGLIGRLASLHFAPTETARANLLREGVPPGTIRVTGNTGIDALLAVCGRSPPPAREEMILVTGHRRESFDGGLARTAGALARLARRPGLRLVVALHLNPRAEAPLRAALGAEGRVCLLPPQDYTAFVELMRRARLIVTDSGGVQEEAPSLGVPVLVTRDETDRPEAVEAGTVRLVGTDGAGLLAAAEELLDDPAAHARMARTHNPYGDGRAAPRIVEALLATQPVRRALSA